MTLETVFFYLIAAFTLYSAYFVVSAWSLFRSAIGLTAVLLGVAGLYLLMAADFLAAVQVAIYVGGTVVLIIFAILMVSDVTQRVYHIARFWRRVLALLAAEALFGLITGAFVAQRVASGPRPEPAAATTRQIGRALLDSGAGGFVLPFEVISLVLLAALIGALTIAAGAAVAVRGGAKE